MERPEFKNLEELQEHDVFKNFSDICKIPHPSFEEKALSDYILNWAKNLGLKVKQDEYHNLLITKPATKAYENKKGVVLQAHIDMVCEKSVNSNHNFKIDPIGLVLEDDILSTGGETTLGADNGIGVAMAMAVLEDDELQHPELSVIFTTAEEEDMSGALNVNSEWLTTNQIINLDNSFDDMIVAGSAGGKGVELKLPIEYIDLEDGLNSYKIEVKGLTGGHSGEDINKGLANAIALLGRILNAFNNEFEYYINDIRGGNFRLAIPRDSEATITTESLNFGKMISIIEEFSKEWKKLYEVSDRDLMVKVSEIEKVNTALSRESGDKVISTIILSPNGVNNILGDLGVVESSCNLGEIYLRDDEVYFVTEIRATFDTNRESIYEKLQLLSKIMGGSIRDFAKYPSWIYRSHSPLRDKANEIYSSMYGGEMKVLVLHAGLECGCFTDKVEDMDAISIGPNTWNLHSPTESLSVSSTIKSYDFLLELLKNLN